MRLFLLITLSILFTSCSKTNNNSARPNILFIMSDEHAYQAIRAYNNTLINTPNIDRIANSGMLFTNASVTNSICAPSRATILTGKHTHINGKIDNRDLDPVDELIKQRIQEFINYLTQETEKYDIYHSQDFIRTNALKVLRDQGIIPHFIRTVHHIDEFNSSYLQECHDRSILEPDLCLCVSNYWQQQLRQQYQVEAPIIINGVDTNRFSSMVNGREVRLKHQLGISGNPVYLTIGGIEPRKNSLKLLQAFIQV